MRDLSESFDPGRGSDLIGGQTRQIAKRAHGLFLITAASGLIALTVWANVTWIDIVTRGSGQVVPTLQNQFVQHLEGGIVEEILVNEGQIVRAGDILMRIRDSFSQAEFDRTRQQLLLERARLARLDAETDQAEEIDFPSDLIGSDAAILQDQVRLFERRRENLEQRLLILQDQMRGKHLELDEHRSRLDNTQLEFDLMEERVAILSGLARQGATSRNELLRSQSELQQIRTRLTDLTHQVPQIEVELSELMRRQRELRVGFLAEVNEERIDTLNRIEQLESTLGAMRDRAQRTEVRAPIDGKVHRLLLTTVGGVVQGGQNLAQLVPTDATVSVEIRLSPKDRGRVWVDLPAVVKLTAYDYTRYGGMPARVTDISSDVLQDDTGEPYYRVNLEADVSAFGDERIVAGMAATVDIITGERTIMEYLLAPLVNMKHTALREY